MGTKIKYDVSDVEGGSDFDTPVPVGLYTARVDEVEDTVSNSSGNPMLAVTMEIIHPKDYKGRKLWEYIVLNEASAWKMRQFTDALGLPPKGSIDIESIVGDKMQVKVKHETDSEYGTRAKIASMISMPEGISDEEEPEEEEAKFTPANDPDEEGELTYEDLADYDREDLEAVIEENDLEDEISFSSRTKDDKLREKIAEALELEPADEPDEDEPEPQDYSEMSLSDLKAVASERGLKTSGVKSALIKRIEKDDADGGDPF